MPFLAIIFARWGLSQRIAGIAAWIATALAIIALCGILWAGFNRYLHNREAEAIAIDRKDVTIEAANRVINATNEADRNQAEADDAFANSQRNLQYEVDTKGAADPVGPATTAVLSRLRDEQRAAATRGATP